MPSADSDGCVVGETSEAKTQKPQKTRKPARVVDGWLFVDGCKVARVEEGQVIAFKDKCRRRSSRRGTDQVRVTLHELEQALRKEAEVD